MSTPQPVPTRIAAEFEKILSHYPANHQLPAALKKTIDDLNRSSTQNNTPCCMQVCHAFNESGILVPPGNFRPGEPKRVAAEIPLHSRRYYLLAVDEMINYLTGHFGEPLVLDPKLSARLARKKSATRSEVRTLTEPVRGLEGVMTFGNSHIELWNRFNIVQDTGPSAMDFDWVWSRSPVRFWRIGSNGGQGLAPIDALLFSGWWDVFDGNQYYYFIDGSKSKVWYTRTRPSGPHAGIGRGALNSGDVTMDGLGTMVMDWDPADGGATRETFSFDVSQLGTMTGRSNRYARLTAKKMFVLG